jgi:Ca-activated chloride channel family protein
VSGRKRPKHLWAGALALLPFLGGDDAAEQAVRDGNALYEQGQYGAALERYRAAARLKPDAAEIAFNQGSAWYREGDIDKALEHYMAALGAADPALRGRAKYSIGVIRLQQAVAAEASPGQAMPHAQEAIRYFRESLQLDRRLTDARYNLELGYRFLEEMEGRLVGQQRSDPRLLDDAFLRRGMAQQDLVSNDPGRQRKTPDRLQDSRSERTDEPPEKFAPNERPPERGDTPMPVSVNPLAASELLERLLKQIAAMETWRQETRRAALQAPGERDPW